jgi:rhodanese-related sulfurtransferase
MASPTEITTSQLSRLIGTPDAPSLVDVCIDEDFFADPRLIPGSMRRSHTAVAEWAPLYRGKRVVVICQKGLKLSQGVSAWLRHHGISAEALEGGIYAWRDEGNMLLKTENLPARDNNGHTVWVTRERPKIDRIACPWLIRRFVDPGAVFLYVKPADVESVAERFSATPFDVEGVYWSHRGDRCTFDTMLDEMDLDSEPLRHLAEIVRGADTSRNELAPQSAGLLAISLGFSRMYRDDLAQLGAAMGTYDALYRWVRDATDETHNWPATAKAGQAKVTK